LIPRALPFLSVLPEAVVAQRKEAHNMYVRSVVVLLTFFIALANAGLAQTERPPQIGAQFTALKVDAVGEGPVGVGGRASYDLRFRRLTMAPELEFSHYPQNPSGDFGETQLLFGARAGVRIDRFGFFLKARPGLVHFGGNNFTRRNGSATNFAVDLGGVFEYYTSHRVVLRLDLGDTLINFPQPIFVDVTPPVNPAGWYHNFQRSFGVSWRF
jgi:hypothetical protein